MADLSLSLNDPTNQQWPTLELSLYWVEALRTWNALTSMWRGQAAFPTTAGNSWYDLSAVAGSPRQFTVTDQSIHQVIEYHLLEPPLGYPGPWTGSAQFSLADILVAWNFISNEVLGATGATLAVSWIAAPIARAAPYTDSLLAVRRVAWVPTFPSTYVVTVLEPGEQWEKDLFDAQWSTSPQAPPGVWMQSIQPPLAVYVDRVPPCPGQYELVSVPCAPTSTGAAPVTMNLPDDWSWVVKWGTLAEMLTKDSTSQDTIREQYCRKRYQDGVELLRTTSSVLDGQINGLPVSVGAVQTADRFNPSWEGATPSSATSLYTTGLNLVAVAPPPAAGGDSVVLNVVVNAPVGSPVQLSREDYQAVQGYAKHLAMFKRGGQEFMTSIPLFAEFMRQAAFYNSKLAGSGPFQPQAYALSGRDREVNVVGVGNSGRVGGGQNG